MPIWSERRWPRSEPATFPDMTARRADPVSTTDRMTWEEKLAACQALAECHLRMRKPGDWYVSHRADVATGCMLEGRFGNGNDPREAVENHWCELTMLKGDERVVVGAMDQRREVRWNGFMWQDWKEAPRG